MDRRDVNEGPAYLKDKEVSDDDVSYDGKIMENGVPVRVPYKLIKEVTFNNVSKQELRDIEHSARLQYRLLLMDAILKAKVEFNKQRIIITYNPTGADNRKEKVSQRELVDFLAKEGVHIDQNSIDEKDVDYYNEIYKYQFDPTAIREHAPYTYTREQWKKMKPKWTKMRDEAEAAKLVKFRNWQQNYAVKHSDILAAEAAAAPKKKRGVLAKLFGKKEENEKGFWFHGT